MRKLSTSNHIPQHEDVSLYTTPKKETPLVFGGAKKKKTEPPSGLPGELLGHEMLGVGPRLEGASTSAGCEGSATLRCKGSGHGHQSRVPRRIGLRELRFEASFPTAAPGALAFSLPAVPASRPSRPSRPRPSRASSKPPFPRKPETGNGKGARPRDWLGANLAKVSTLFHCTSRRTPAQHTPSLTLAALFLR